MAITCFSGIGITDSVSSKIYQVGVMDTLSKSVYQKYSNWVYWNEPPHNFPNNDWQSRYWGGLDNYNRLLSIKRQYDPLNIFTCYHCIGYVNVDNEDPSVCPQKACTCSNTPNGICNSSAKLIVVLKTLFISMFFAIIIFWT